MIWLPTIWMIGFLLGMLLAKGITWLAEELCYRRYLAMQWMRHRREARGLEKHIANGGEVITIDDAGHLIQTHRR